REARGGGLGGGGPGDGLAEAVDGFLVVAFDGAHGAPGALEEFLRVLFFFFGESPGHELGTYPVDVVDVPVPGRGRRRVLHGDLDDGGEIGRERLAQGGAELGGGLDGDAARAEAA